MQLYLSVCRHCHTKCSLVFICEHTHATYERVIIVISMCYATGILITNEACRMLSDDVGWSRIGVARFEVLSGGVGWSRLRVARFELVFLDLE